ncbi:hypothetical protein CLF_108213 [Clonorchis sinensis]|uniref:Uncharacterized protein n=1 Tax=Clonorchis sinensis TaxID=79923 RepID=G7YRD7_CLOSI|nr:hypothetical protein CLF_108213 [Clonorchis sinensis]
MRVDRRARARVRVRTYTDIQPHRRLHSKRQNYDDGAVFIRYYFRGSLCFQQVDVVYGQRKATIFAQNSHQLSSNVLQYQLNLVRVVRGLHCIDHISAMPDGYSNHCPEISHRIFKRLFNRRARDDKIKDRSKTKRGYGHKTEVRTKNKNRRINNSYSPHDKRVRYLVNETDNSMRNCRLPGWELRDSCHQWLMTLAEMVQLRSQWRSYIKAIAFNA